MMTRWADGMGEPPPLLANTRVDQMRPAVLAEVFAASEEEED
jgi:hypothetical protein